MKKTKKPFYKKWWFIFLMLIVLVIIANSVKTGLKNMTDKDKTYIWPDSTLTNMLPQPSSKYGEISLESEQYFQIDVYKISQNQFEDYAENCKDKGFIVDYKKSSSSYSALDENGYSLNLFYQDKEKTLDISLIAPDDKEEDIFNTPEPDEEEKETENLSDSEKTSDETDDTTDIQKEPEESSKPEEESVSDIRPEFKDMLDSYEAYINEYCEFMEKYAESENDSSMLVDYLKMMDEYLEFSKNIAALGEEEMNDAEAQYYLDVTLRVSQKLLELPQISETE